MLKIIVGDTPLHAAAFCGHRKAVESLISLGANLHAQAEDGITLLHAAAVSGNLTAIACLIQKNGSPINTFNTAGYTPLYGAL